MNTDFSARDDAGIEAADGIDVDISVVVNMIDLKPQFIHMSRQHDSRAAVGVVYRNRVAMRVNGDFIRVFLRFPPSRLHVPGPSYPDGPGALSMASRKAREDLRIGLLSEISPVYGIVR